MQHDRPFTAAGHTPHSPDYYPYSPYDDHDIDDDDESEVDGVFAYLPPSTAEQDIQRQQQQQQQQPPLVTTVFTPYIASPPPTAPRPVTSYAPVETPPSTSSRTDDGSISHSNPTSLLTTNVTTNSFRLRRINSASVRPQSQPVSPISVPSQAQRNTSSHGRASLSRMSAFSQGTKEVRVELPSSKGDPGRDREKELDMDMDGDLENEKDLDLEEGGSRSYLKQRAVSVDSGSISVTPSLLDYIDAESRPGSIKMGFDFDTIEEEDSPYPEVRASVSNMDDPEMPAMTARMWAIGLVLCMIASALNVFFNFRQPAPTVVPLVLLLLSYPVGKFLALTLPIRIFRMPRWFFGGFSFSLNPGPWNIKEHVLVYIMANVAVGSPYALNAIVVSEVYYNIKLGFGFNLVLVLATQLTGFGLAGLCRRFLVWPASMVWPQNLVACTLLNTLHAEDEQGMGGLTRYKFYCIVTFGAFTFFFLPGFLFTALSVFSWVCWIAPSNVPLNQLFGVSSGLGMSVVTFDWTQISWIGSPLMVPWWAELHVFLGFVLFYWILTPILYYTNVWQLQHFPISANEPYDRFGNVYNVTSVLTPNHTLDVPAYEAYSPLYLPATYAATYLLAFALSTCVIVHTILYHGKALLNGLKRIKLEKDDIHAKLMRSYPEVPDWWYLGFFCVFFALAIVAVEVWHTGVPVWALGLAVILPVVYVLPNGFIYAMTGQGISVNLVAQIIPGTVLPGNPLANMVFKAYSVQTLAEATNFVQDLKLGHYIKVPPRATFTAQCVATILAAFVQVGVKEWMFANVVDICQPEQKSNLTCPHNQVFFTASAVWGLIGPVRQFGVGKIYHAQLFALIIGALLPVPFWLWQRRHPDSWTKNINMPVMFIGVGYIPPATGINYSSWFAVGFLFQYFIRRRNFGWWSKFNYVTSAALDSGTVLALIFIFFTLQFPRQGKISVNWWGNTVYENTADFNRTPLRPVPIGS